MTTLSNKEILVKAIQKAIDGGFNESNINEVELGATGLIFRKDFAKALWGERIEPVVVPHDVPAKRSGFTPWNNEFGEDYGDWSHVPEDLFKCVNCGMRWGKRFHSISGTVCEPMSIPGKLGFQYRLQQMVLAEDPIAYLGENLND